MAKARRLFLETGHYDFLAESICKEIKKSDNVLDICCGEGYYTDFFRRKTGASVSGFDISKEMIKLAAKKYKETFFFVANIARIPVKDESTDIAVQICAPFSEKEFARILKKDGKLLSVVPAGKHLWEMKDVLYEKPYKNNEDDTQYAGLILTDEITVSNTIRLSSSEEIMSLFAMTPYYYRTRAEDKEKLRSLDSLSTRAEFTIRVFKRR